MDFPRTAELPGAALIFVLVKIPVAVFHCYMHMHLAGSRLLSFLQGGLARAVQFTGSGPAPFVLLYCLS